MPAAVGAVLMQHDHLDATIVLWHTILAKMLRYITLRLTLRCLPSFVPLVSGAATWKVPLSKSLLITVPILTLIKPPMRTRSNDACAGLTSLAATTTSGNTALVVLMLLTPSRGPRNPSPRFARACLSYVCCALTTQRAPVGRRLALMRALLQVPHRSVISWVSFQRTAVCPLRLSVFVGTLTLMQAHLVMPAGRQHKKGGVTHPLCSLRIPWCSSGCLQVRQSYLFSIVTCHAPHLLQVWPQRVVRRMCSLSFLTISLAGWWQGTRVIHPCLLLSAQP